MKDLRHERLVLSHVRLKISLDASRQHITLPVRAEAESEAEAEAEARGEAAVGMWRWGCGGGVLGLGRRATFLQAPPPPPQHRARMQLPFLSGACQAHVLRLSVLCILSSSTSCHASISLKPACHSISLPLRHASILLLTDIVTCVLGTHRGMEWCWERPCVHA
jgi:hypothetical protein